MIRFGVQLRPEDYSLDGFKKVWREAEILGYNSAWIPDHFYPMSRQKERNVFEAWTLLPTLAAETEHLRLGVLVTCNSYRSPSVLAKIAATVDVTSRGRLEFAIGAGWYKEEYDAYGIRFPDAKIRIEQLAEAVELIKRIWTQKKVNFQGKYYTARDLVSYPKPLQKPHPPIWVGGQGNRLLRIVAQHADYANFLHCPIREFQQRLNVLKRHCSNVGRNFEEIKKTWHGFIIIAEETEAKRMALKFEENSVIDQIEGMVIAGPTEKCVEEIQKYVDLGVKYFIPYFPVEKDLKVFMEKVATNFK
jgi:F420-dependent oxidoreductase-like protein